MPTHNIKNSKYQSKPPSDAEISKSQEETLKNLNIRTGQVKIGGDILWVDFTRYPEIFFRTKASMKADYAHWTVLNNEGNPTNAYDWWLREPRRMRYEELIFDPQAFFDNGRDPRHLYDPANPYIGKLNLFTGFETKPNAHGSCDLFYDHLLNNYVSGDEQAYNVILNWMAHLVQRPGVPIGYAVAVVGDYGTGKTIVSDELAAIIGQRYSPTFTTPESLLGKFNAPLAKCLLGRVEEAINPRDPRHRATLKNLLSGGDVALELKGVDPIMIPNRANFIFTSNDEHFLAAGSQGERRYFAVRCGNGRQQDGEYFRKLKRQMEAGGRGRLLYDLLNRDISSVDFTSPPRTAVLSTQIRAGLTGLDRWWADVLESGELIFQNEPITIEPLGWEDVSDGAFCPLKTHIMSSAIAYSRDYAGRSPTPAQVGRFLVENADAKPFRPQPKLGVREQRYQLPPLDVCRKLFIAKRAGLRIEHVGGAPETPTTGYRRRVRRF